MVCEAAEAGGFQSGLSCFADGGTAPGVLVVGGDIPDAGMEADPVVSGPDDSELGAQHGRVGDRLEVRVLSALRCPLKLSIQAWCASSSSGARVERRLL
jgi:hypothetical protein